VRPPTVAVAMRRSRKPFGVQASRGFKSLPLRLNERLPGQGAALIRRIAVFEPQRQSREIHGRLQASIGLRRPWRTTGARLSGSTTGMGLSIPRKDRHPPLPPAGMQRERFRHCVRLPLSGFTTEADTRPGYRKSARRPHTLQIQIGSP
jgi:hypothetical protein